MTGGNRRKLLTIRRLLKTFPHNGREEASMTGIELNSRQPVITLRHSFSSRSHIDAKMCFFSTFHF